MQKLARSLTFVAFVVVLMLAGTESVVAQSEKFPVGTYESGPFTIAFKDGGAFEVTHSNGGGVKGTYKLSGDQAELTDLEGDFACPDAVGKYTWKVDADKLAFTVIDDQCEGRAEVFSQPLAKKSSK